MFRNVASQKFYVFAFDATTNVPKVSDAAQITAYVAKDFGSATVLSDTSATEVDATNAPGYYVFDAAQAETNADTLLVSAKSSTANIKVLGAPAVIFPTPANFSTLSVDSNGRVDVIKVAGTTQTARDLGTSVLLSSGTGTGQVSLSSGTVTITDASLTSAKFGSGAITATVVADGAIDRATFAADTGLQSIRSNTAQAGAAGTITLDASASATTDFYKGAGIYLTGGTGVGQNRICSAYNGSTKVATISPNWATNPDNTSTFAIIPAGGVLTSGDIADAVWDEDLSGHTTASTAGKYLGDLGTVSVANNALAANLTRVAGSALSTSSAQIGVNVVNMGGSALSTTSAQVGVNVVQLSTDATAADNAESFFDGTGYAGTGNVIPTVTTLTGHTAQTGDAYARIGAPVGASISADIAAGITSTIDGVLDGVRIQKNTQLAAFPFVMRDSTNHAPATGLTVTATRSLDGAAFASCANSVAEVANGWYKITLATTDLNADTVALKFTATGADATNITIITQPKD
jgi:hypothetical protein